jgi:hypothetical protein
MGRIGPILLLAALLTACQTTARHQFAEPTSPWQAKSGQLSYTDRQTTLIGEVLVRFSRDGHFELTFTKAGGLTLLSLRADAEFARIEGPLARGGWSGRIAEAPERFRGWIQLREKLATGQRMTTVRHDHAGQSFTFRF